MWKTLVKISRWLFCLMWFVVWAMYLKNPAEVPVFSVECGLFIAALASLEDALEGSLGRAS